RSTSTRRLRADADDPRVGRRPYATVDPSPPSTLRHEAASRRLAVASGRADLGEQARQPRAIDRLHEVRIEARCLRARDVLLSSPAGQRDDLRSPAGLAHLLPEQTTDL